MKRLIKAYVFGFLGSLSLFIFYFLLMMLGKNSFMEALSQLMQLILWIVPLVASFGIEIGLFIYAKSASQVSGKSPIVGSATSGLAMVACCAHHITDILPLVGFSVLTTFLTTYQPIFFTIGIISNLAGIFLVSKKLFINKSAKRKFVIFTVLLSPLITIFLGLLLITSVYTGSSLNTILPGNQTYQSRENNDKQVIVIVTPQSISFAQQVVFQVAMNNHMYDLSNDLQKTAILTDNRGNTYRPLSWNGTTGGHHVLGQLTFPAVANNASSVTLTLPLIAGVDRVFSWKL